MKLKGVINNSNLKYGAIVIAINILALLPLCCFAFQHFSLDSYGMVNNLEAHCIQNVLCYRWFGAAIFKIWMNINNPILNPLPDVIIYVLLVSLSISAFSRFIFKHLGCNSFLSFIIINTSILISFTNPWFTDYLSYPECILFIGVGVVLCVVSIMTFFTLKINLIFRIFISGILLILSTAIIQQFLVVFIVYSVLLSVIESKKDNDSKIKTIILKYVKLFFFILVCSILYFVISIVVRNTFEIVGNARAVLDLNQVLENIKYYLTHQHSYLRGRGLFNSELLTICYLLTMGLWVISFVLYVRKHRFNFLYVIILLSFVFGYFSLYITGVLSTARGTRELFPLFCTFALFSIGVLLFTEKRLIKCGVVFVLAVVFLLSIYKTQEIFSIQIRQNVGEELQGRLYYDEILKYEKENNTTIKNIKITSDDNCSFTGSALDYKFSFSGLMKYISKRDFFVSVIDESDKMNYFEKDWDRYIPEEQLHFDGDTLYLCVY